MFEVARRMVFSGALVGTIAVLLYWLDKKYNFSQKKYWLWQLFIGILFGGLVYVNILLAPYTNSISDNVQNIIPMSAGLIFGAPAALISSAIGILISMNLNITVWSFVRETAAVSLGAAGIFAAFLRYYMFDDKIPSWVYGLGAGFMTAAFHMLSLLLRHMNHLQQAYVFVKTFNIYMLVISSISLTMTLYVIHSLGRDATNKEIKKNGITTSFEQGLLVCVMAAFLVTCGYSWFVQTTLSQDDSHDLLLLNIRDLSADIEDASDQNIIQVAKLLATKIDPSYYVNEGTKDDFSNHKLNNLLTKFNVSEIHLIDKAGIIVASSTPQYVGFNMASGSQSAYFMPLLQGTKAMVQKYQPLTFNKKISRKFAGVILPGGGFLQIGYEAEQFQKKVDEEVAGITRNKHIGATGGIIICNKEGVIVSDNLGMEGYHISDLGMQTKLATMAPYEVFSDNVIQESCLCMYAPVESYSLITFIPGEEVMFSRNIGAYITAYMEIVL